MDFIESEGRIDMVGQIQLGAAEVIAIDSVGSYAAVAESGKNNKEKIRKCKRQDCYI